MTPHSRHTFPPQRVVLTLLTLVLGTIVALSLPSIAAAKIPCGQQVVNDWYDNGRIDRLYPLHCYEEAIDLIPADIRDYADAEEVISRALQGALRGVLTPGGDDPTPGDNNQDPGGPAGGGSGGNNSGGPTPGGDTGSGTPQATPDINTSGPSSVPIPLVVLGGMSLALLAAGGLGYLSRRRQAAAEEFDDHNDDDQPLG